jgi:hypothetical protein
MYATAVAPESFWLKDWFAGKAWRDRVLAEHGQAAADYLSTI